MTILLQRGADVNCFNIYRNSPLHLAAPFDQSDLVALLLQHGADFNCLVWTNVELVPYIMRLTLAIVILWQCCFSMELISTVLSGQTWN
jgi:ankyrin repeat protein